MKKEIELQETLKSPNRKTFYYAQTLMYETWERNKTLDISCFNLIDMKHVYVWK